MLTAAMAGGVVEMFQVVAEPMDAAEGYQHQTFGAACLDLAKCDSVTCNQFDERCYLERRAALFVELCRIANGVLVRRRSN